MAGIVDALGRDVTHVRVGQRVLVTRGTFVSRRLLRGGDLRSSNFPFPAAGSDRNRKMPSPAQLQLAGALLY